MLEQLLQEIRKGEATSPAELAKKMNTSQSMVAAMLDTLEQQGYLTSLVTTHDCGDETPCDACALASLCSTKNSLGTKIRVLR